MTVVQDIMTADPTCVRASEIVHAGELPQGTPVLVDANDDVGTVLRKMSDHKVRWLPVQAISVD